MKLLSLILAPLLLHSSIVLADNQLQLVGQFGKKAVLLINGVQRMMSINSVSPEGVKLIQVERDYVIVLDNGEKKTVDFSTHMSTRFDKKEMTEVKIWADQTGSYVTTGSINGQMVSFLVDTGATSIAMNEHVAKRLGIDYRYLGIPMQAVTASGFTSGYSIKLSSVKVGNIELNNVDAAVLEGGFPREVLLGMSFLKNIKLERNNNLMTLKQLQPAKKKK